MSSSERDAGRYKGSVIDRRARAFTAKVRFRDDKSKTQFVLNFWMMLKKSESFVRSWLVVAKGCRSYPILKKDRP
jgi:hypothetical protein